jgi:ABC-2 type transport system permease protein
MLFNKIVLQLKRDMWEYRFSFIWMPLIAIIIPISIVMLMFSLGPDSATAGNGGFEMDGTYFKDFVVVPPVGGEAYFDFHKSHAFDFFAKFGVAISWLIFSLVYVVCASNFAFSCLFTDRKNNSILFWRSLPVSETLNVVSKLLAIVFIVPAIVTVSFALCIALILFGGVVYAGDFSLLSSLVPHITIPNVTGFSLSYVWNALIFLPFAAWALFMSALVRNHPGVIGILFPAMLWIIDELVQRFLGFGLGLQALISGYGNLINGYFSASNTDPMAWLFSMQFAKVILVSLSIAAMFGWAAIWLRNNRYEI